MGLRFMFAADRDELPRFSELEAEYEFLGELGRGGTAVVYLARERALDRKVAIKVIRATYVEDEEAAARLTREALTVAGLQHPNIVILYGTRRLRDDSLALVMQYVAGRTLKTEVQETGPLDFVRTGQILRDIGGALTYAHRHRIVHRDIKPENIYLDAETGLARLSDFGIARPWDADSGLTLPGSAIGTPAYMSPEQIDGGVLDGRSDIYSLGLVGYEMLTGTRPWAGETLFSIVVKQQREPLPPLRGVRPGVPCALEQAIEGAIRKRADERWPSADAFLDALNGRPVALLPVASTTAPAPRITPAGSAQRDAVNSGGHTIRFDRSASVVEEKPAAEPTDAAAPVPRRARWPLIAAAVAAVIVVGAGLTLAFSHVPETPAAVVSGAAPVAAEAVAAAPSLEQSTTAAAPPAVALAVSGDAQSGAAGDTLREPLVVRVEDATGHAVAGAAVRFTIVKGEGSLTALESATDSTGIARARWLPHAPGTHTVEAHVDSVAQPVRFAATALPRPPAKLSAVSETELRGIAGTSSQLSVKVENDRRRPVAGVTVRFTVRSGDGRFTPAAPVTDASGVAHTEWLLGTAGAQEAAATLANEPGSTVVFRAAVTQPPLPVQRTVALGGTHTCLLSGEGTASCWGGNDSGQLGDGTARRRATPVRVSAAEPLATIAAGVGHSCAVNVLGAVLCWGANDSGQLGDGSRGSRGEPAPVRFDERSTKVAVGASHSCAPDTAGGLYCWGKNTHGQLGDGTRTDRPVPVQAGGPRTFRSLALGWAHTCALATDGAAYCWGRNTSGELGDGGTADRADPVRVAGGHRFTALAAGSSHTCGLVTDGSIACWGQNTNGQLGNGQTASSALPVAVVGAESFVAVAAGGVHTCGLTREGAAFCWGRNMYGQLGDGTIEDRSRPVPVAGALRFSSIFANGAHTCATAAGGALYCWGFNLDGQVGDGTRSNRLRPVPAGRQE